VSPGAGTTAGVRRSVARDLLGATGLGVAAALVVGGWPGAVAGTVTAVTGYRLLRRVEPAAVRRTRSQAAAALPLAADLVAAALRAGLPVQRAVAVVAPVVPPALAGVLAQVADRLGLGLAAELAWAPLGTVPGGERLVAAVVRSADSGAALAGALTRLAEDARQSRQVAVQAVAERAGVLFVLPLGLCFLPAFILAGVVPVVAAVLAGVLR